MQERKDREREGEEPERERCRESLQTGPKPVNTPYYRQLEPLSHKQPPAPEVRAART